MNTWLDIAMRPDVKNRSLRVALLVGTILVCINYIDRVFSGSLTSIDYVKMLMTYCVPFCVSTHASVSAIMKKEKDPDNEKV